MSVCSGCQGDLVSLGQPVSTLQMGLGSSRKEVEKPLSGFDSDSDSDEENKSEEERRQLAEQEENRPKSEQGGSDSNTKDNNDKEHKDSNTFRDNKDQKKSGPSSSRPLDKGIKSRDGSANSSVDIEAGFRGSSKSTDSDQERTGPKSSLSPKPPSVSPSVMPPSDYPKVAIPVQRVTNVPRPSPTRALVPPQPFSQYPQQRFAPVIQQRQPFQPARMPTDVQTSMAPQPPTLSHFPDNANAQAMSTNGAICSQRSEMMLRANPQSTTTPPPSSTNEPMLQSQAMPQSLYPKLPPLNGEDSWFQSDKPLPQEQATSTAAQTMAPMSSQALPNGFTSQQPQPNQFNPQIRPQVQQSQPFQVMPLQTQEHSPSSQPPPFNGFNAPNASAPATQAMPPLNVNQQTMPDQNTLHNQLLQPRYSPQPVQPRQMVPGQVQPPQTAQPFLRTPGQPSMNQQWQDIPRYVILEPQQQSLQIPKPADYYAQLNDPNLQNQILAYFEQQLKANRPQQVPPGHQQMPPQAFSPQTMPPQAIPPQPPQAISPPPPPAQPMPNNNRPPTPSHYQYYQQQPQHYIQRPPMQQNQQMPKVAPQFNQERPSQQPNSTYQQQQQYLSTVYYNGPPKYMPPASLNPNQFEPFKPISPSSMASPYVAAQFYQTPNLHTVPPTGAPSNSSNRRTSPASNVSGSTASNHGGRPPAGSTKPKSASNVKEDGRMTTGDHLEALHREIQEIKALVRGQDVKDVASKMEQMISNFRKMKLAYQNTITELKKNVHFRAEISRADSVIGQTYRKLKTEYESIASTVEDSFSKETKQMLASMKRSPKAWSPHSSKQKFTVRQQDLRKLNDNMDRLMGALMQLKNASAAPSPKVSPKKSPNKDPKEPTGKDKDNRK